MQAKQYARYRERRLRGVAKCVHDLEYKPTNKHRRHERSEQGPIRSVAVVAGLVEPLKYDAEHDASTAPAAAEDCVSGVNPGEPALKT